MGLEKALPANVETVRIQNEQIETQIKKKKKDPQSRSTPSMPDDVEIFPQRYKTKKKVQK